MMASNEQTVGLERSLQEAEAQRQLAEEERQRAESERQLAERERQEAEAARRAAEEARQAAYRALEATKAQEQLFEKVVRTIKRMNDDIETLKEECDDKP
jgi:hypothetical protein